MSDHPDTLATIAAAVVALGVGALSSLVTFLVSKRPAQAAEVTAEAAWQTAMNAGFEALTQQYETANRALIGKVEHLEGTVRDLAQHVESLESILRANGLPIPTRPVPVNLHGLQVVSPQ